MIVETLENEIYESYHIEISDTINKYLLAPLLITFDREIMLALRSSHITLMK